MKIKWPLIGQKFPPGRFYKLKKSQRESFPRQNKRFEGRRCCAFSKLPYQLSTMSRRVRHSYLRLCIDVMGSQAFLLTLNLSPLAIHIVPSLPKTHSNTNKNPSSVPTSSTSNAIKVSVQGGNTTTAPSRRHGRHGTPKTFPWIKP